MSIDQITQDAATKEAMPESTAQEREIELRMHKALQAAWKHVNITFASQCAKDEVGRYANAPADAIIGKRIPMLFALQEAWGFVHGAKDKTLMGEIGELLDHGQRASKSASPKV